MDKFEYFFLGWYWIVFIGKKVERVYVMLINILDELKEMLIILKFCFD